MSTLVLALIPAIIISIAFVGYCLRDLSRSSVSLLPRWAWALVILASIPLGGILYLAFGKRHE